MALDYGWLGISAAWLLWYRLELFVHFMDAVGKVLPKLCACIITRQLGWVMSDD